MNVAWVVPGGVDRSGIERVIPALLWLLERVARRHPVTVVALAQERGPGEWLLCGARVVNVGRWPRSVRAAGTLLRAHRRRRFDVVHAFWAAGSGTAAAAFARLTRTPLLLHVAGGELVSLPQIGYGGWRRWHHRAQTRLTLRTATAVTAASAGMIARLEELGIAAERVPLGVDSSRWPSRSPVPRPADRPARLVHVASLNRVKDQGMLLQACARLAAAGVSFTLDVVGEDTLGGALQREAERMRLAQVRWHGFLTQDRLRPVVEGADLFVLTSQHEAGPVAVLEAAACGVPTVGTVVGHVAELAPHAAIAVPVGDADALAGAIRSLLDDEPRRLALARAAQAWAEAQDADATAALVETLYQRLAEQRR